MSYRGAIILLTLMIASCVAGPPVQEMSDARQAIAAAEESNAATLAPEELNEARRLLEQAETQLRARYYTLAQTTAIQARSRAVEALQASQAANQD